MTKVKLTKVVIPQSEIIRMDEKMKKRFIMFTCIMRDLNLLQKCLAYTSNNKPKKEPSISANTTINFFFLKTLISKTHEMWSFINRNKVLDDYQKFSDDLKKKIYDIENFFSDKKVENIFSFIRNKFGFHYEYWDDIDKSIDNAFKKFDHYEAWLSSKDSANEIFSSSNAVILQVIFSEMQQLGFVGDEKQLMDIIFKLTLKIARLFQEFSTFYLTEAFSVKWEQQKEMEIDVPLISEVTLPLIISRRKI